MRLGRATRLELEASLRTLRRPFAPRRVTLGARALPRSSWSFDRRRGLLRVRARAAAGTATLRVR
ncbi:MAG: hypothetical protein HZB46_09555 [Solirubrobacterales bacterium]|nr:hypothetical protein [Solirubrobacterales bacterium]